MPDGVAAELPGILELRELDGLDRPGCEQVLALSEADPDVDGGQLAFKVAEVGLDVPGYGRETAGEDLPGFAGQRPVPEPYPGTSSPNSATLNASWPPSTTG